MNIVHTEASCGWGGQEIRILEESRGLIERGHEVVVLCPPQARIFAEAPRRGVPAVALPIGRKNLRGLFALRRWLRNHPADVVNTHSSTDTWLAALACASLRHAPPLVRTRHISAAVPDNAASRWLYARAVRHVVTTGEALRRQLIERVGVPAERVTSVPTGIDTECFSPVSSAADKAAAKTALGLDQNKIHIGIVATLRSWKGHLYLLDAFAQLQRPDLQLVIVGEGPMREPITEKIAALGLGDRVTLAGQRTDPERWLQAMDVFCLPSYANEGVPQAILQAMLCALPIVTTPVGSILEAVSDGETALVVPPKDATALAAAISRLLDDPALAAHLGDHARRVASADFSKDTMLDRMETLFRQARSS